MQFHLALEVLAEYSLFSKTTIQKKTSKIMFKLFENKKETKRSQNYDMATAVT